MASSMFAGVSRRVSDIVRALGESFFEPDALAPVVAARLPAQHSAVLAQQLVQHNAAGGGDVERVLDAEHGDSHVDVAGFSDCGLDAVDLVAEDDADGEARLPVEEINRAGTGFDGGEFEASGAEVVEKRSDFPMVFPGQAFFGAEGGLGDLLFGRITGDAAEVEFFEAAGVAGTEKRSNVVEAANVIEEDGGGEFVYVVVGGGEMGCGEGEAIGGHGELSL